MNEKFIRAICKQLNINTKITRSSDYVLQEGKTERLAGLCSQAAATEYISGPAARDYIEPEIFASQNLSLTWFNYSGFAEYTQLWGSFEHGVTALDLLFNCGPDACNFLRHTTAKRDHGIPTELQLPNNSAGKLVFARPCKADQHFVVAFDPSSQRLPTYAESPASPNKRR